MAKEAFQTAFETLVAAAFTDAIRVRPAASMHAPPSAGAGFAREAVGRAIALKKLRDQYQITGFQALPLDQYLVILSQKAGTSLPVPESAPIGQMPARLAPLITLARMIGTSLEHLRLWVRAWFVCEAHPASCEVAFARASKRQSASIARQVPGLHASVSPSEADTVLMRAESAYDAETRQMLHSILDKL
jgi:hypothetical protein